MKIAVVVGSLHMGGLEKVTVHIVNALSDDYDIDLIVLNTNNNFYSINESVNVIEGNISYSFIEKVVRKLKRIGNNSLSKILWKEVQFIRQICEQNKYEYIVASDGMNSMLVNEAIFNTSLKDTIKLVSWLHNDFSTYFNNYYKNYKENLIISLQNSHTVLCLTDQDKLEYSRYNSNTRRVYNPLTINKTKISELKEKEIIFVGRLVKEQKGLDYLLEITEQIKDTGWKIRIVGSGSDQAWLEQEICNRNIKDHVILHGAVKENIEEIYANASLFISTSRWEGFGLVITEAMACGLPIIAFDNSGPREILGEGNYGILVPKYEVAIFISKIKELIFDNAKLESYSEKSLLRSKDFSTDTISKEWREILK